MKQVLYHIHTPPPEMDGTEAVLNEVTDLQQYLAGDIVFMMHRKPSQFRWQIWLRGLQKILDLRQKEKDIYAHIVFHSELFPFLYLAFLRKPIIYTVVSGLGDRPIFPPRILLNRLKSVVVSNKEDKEWLHNQGIQQTALIRSAVNLSEILPSQPPPQMPFRLLIASAPWTKQQFETKGIKALLQVVQHLDWLQLIFLWRGVLYEEMLQLIEEHDVSKQVEVINRVVDVPQLLQTVHAVGLIGNTRRHIKAFPRSLLESLAAHRPIILSDCIPMSTYVKQNECGVIVEGIQIDDIMLKLHLLRSDYNRLQSQTRHLNMTEFSVETMVSGYNRLLVE